MAAGITALTLNGRTVYRCEVCGSVGTEQESSQCFEYHATALNEQDPTLAGVPLNEDTD